MLLIRRVSCAPMGDPCLLSCDTGDADRGHTFSATKLRKAGIFSRVDDSNTSIGKRYARNDELGTPYGVTLDFACASLSRSGAARAYIRRP